LTCCKCGRPSNEKSSTETVASHSTYMRMIARYRIIVTIKADKRQGVRPSDLDTSCFKIRVRERKQGTFFFGKKFADCLVLHRRGLDEFFRAFSFQISVKCRKVLKFRERNHKVLADVFDGVLDMPFLLRLANTTKMVLKKVTGFQLHKTIGGRAATTTDDLCDIDLGVVKCDQRRNAAEKMKESFQGFLKCFGTFTGKGLDITYITVRKRNGGIGNLLTQAADDGLSVAEIKLGLTGRMGKRHEKRFLFLPQFRKRMTNGPISVRIPMFLPKAFINTLCGVTLLAWQRLVFLKVLLKEGEKRGDLTLGTETVVDGGSFVVGNLLNRPKVQTKAAGGFSKGNFLDKKRMPNGSPLFHICEHRVAISE